MSVLYADLFKDAALLIGDEKFSRVTKDNWLSFANHRCRKISSMLRVVKYLWTFDIEADNELYSIPDECVQITRVQYTPTPSNARTFRDLKEYMPDEFRQASDWNFPQGETTHYWADAGFIRMLAMPTTSVAGGGRMEGWGITPDATSENSYMPFQDMMRDVLLEGMKIDALYKLEKYDVAAMADAKWERDVAAMRPQIEDRSDDRRTRVRSANQQRGYIGQI